MTPSLQLTAGAASAATLLLVYLFSRMRQPLRPRLAPLETSHELPKGRRRCDQKGDKSGDSDDEQPKRRVAILGGAFNPPTNQHIQLATEIVHSGQVDAVWLTPCGPRPDKPNMGTTPQQRLVMCEIAVNTSVSATFPIAVSGHETTEAMATYDSLCYLRERYPDCVFSFVVGSDWLQPGTDLRTWESKEGLTGERLVSEFDFLVIRRPGYEVEDLEQFGPRFSWMDLPHGFKLVESTASSTEIRKRATQSWSAESGAVTTLSSLDGLVATGVHAYILRHRLYRKVNWRMVTARAASVRDLVRKESGDKAAPTPPGSRASPLRNAHQGPASSGMVNGARVV